MIVGPMHYRFSDGWDERGAVVIECQKWVPVKETPAGYWLVRDYHYREYVTPDNWYHKSFLRWAPKALPVRLTPDLSQAKLHFTNRKYSQLCIVQNQLERCEKVIAYLKQLGDDPIPEYEVAVWNMGE